MDRMFPGNELEKNTHKLLRQYRAAVRGHCHDRQCNILYATWWAFPGKLHHCHHHIVVPVNDRPYRLMVHHDQIR